MAALIEDYGLIGDRESAALVRRDGSIDWLCWPRFDSDACFAALLGRREHGSWRMGSTVPARLSRRYQPDTLVLETDFEVGTAAVRVVDFMPPHQDSPTLVRIVQGLRGQVEVECDLLLRFDYGRVVPWTEQSRYGFVGRIGPDLIALHSPVPLTIGQGTACGKFIVSANDRFAFILRHGASTDAVPGPVDAEGALHTTVHNWQKWISAFQKPTQWTDAVRRSLLTLRALSDARSGGLVAAPTTSLPEKAGGPLNWDYRYCWLRDATFTISALLNAGYHEEAIRWRDWILRAVAGSPGELRVMYRIDGGRHLDEWSAEWLPGYRGARPVRIGNQAATQHQLDVLGELLDAFSLVGRAGLAPSQQEKCVARGITERIEALWQERGQGIWETRGESRHYTYSKVMAWVGLDRFLRQGGLHGGVEQATLKRLTTLRTQIHDEVCAEGYHPGIGTFVEYFGGQELDASLLLLPLVGFLPVEDPRISGTIAKIERELMEDGLVMRKPPQGREHEGAFLACTCWLADCRVMQGRNVEAREALERVLALRNDLGLLSEQYDVRGRHLSGNFPQALSHLAVVMTALGLSGPVLQRGR